MNKIIALILSLTLILFFASSCSTPDYASYGEYSNPYQPSSVQIRRRPVPSPASSRAQSYTNRYTAEQYNPNSRTIKVKKKSFWQRRKEAKARKKALKYARKNKSRNSTRSSYLPGLNVPKMPRNRTQVDNVSYWSGDGVSGSPKVKINLSEQKAYFYKGKKLVGVSRISSGKDGFNTSTGNFKVIQKNRNHRSNLYGDYVDANNKVVKRDVDVRKDKRPAGTKFRGAKMTNFMRFNGGEGMHAGFLPGYAASHGCVRMPMHMSSKFFNNVNVGTPVIVSY